MLKRILLTLVLCFVVVSPTHAQSNPDLSGLDYVINSFDTTYDVHADSTLTVTERIAVTFNIPKHGIYRWIPTEYVNEDGIRYNLKLRIQSITDGRGNAWPIADTEASNPFFIKIGDADVTLTGPQLYVISYTVKRGVRYFSDHDELYWNVLGNNWDVPILKASATINLSAAVDPNMLQLNCFTGSYGATEDDCTKEVTANTITFRTTRALEVGEDFTVATWLPKGVIYEPSAAEKVWMGLMDNWGLLIPVWVFLLLFLIWWLFGNDAAIEKSIIAQYEENEQISPMVASVLKDDKPQDSEALSAELVYLAVRKYLKIREILNDKKTKAKDYELIKLKEPDDKIKPFQKILLSKIFGAKKVVKVSDLENTFYTQLEPLKKEMTTYIDPFYHVDLWVKHTYKVIAIIVLGLSLVAFDEGSRIMHLIVGGILSSIIIYVFGLYMPKKSQAGIDALWYIQGLQQYIRVAEKHRVKFYEKEHIFEQVLPYAMVFGMAGMWAEAFKDIFKEKPDWFESDRPFTTNVLSNTLTNFQIKTASAMTSSPSSSSGGGSWSSSGFGGGGFSGGGFGGGGGGSW